MLIKHRSIFLIVLLFGPSLMLSSCAPQGNPQPILETAVRISDLSPTPPPFPTQPDLSATPSLTLDPLFVTGIPVADIPALGASQTANPTITPTIIPSLTPSITPSPTATLTPAASLIPSRTPVPAGISSSGSNQAGYPTFNTHPSRIQLGVELLAEGFDEPTGIVSAPGRDALFILEKAGRIRLYENGTRQDVPFMDVTARIVTRHAEQGLLGLAFHPNYKENGYLYIYYTNWDGNSVLSRWHNIPGTETIDMNSEKVILFQRQPEVAHNAGQIVFGPDGYLYVSLGDGGGIGGQFVVGMLGESYLGSILRIDVNNGDPYAIPSGNPFIGNTDMLSEIWVYGLRNPWRFSIDRVTGTIFIGDVGEITREELDVVPPGKNGLNFGWPAMEGNVCFDDLPCNPSAYTAPVWDHGREEGCAIIGGYVYRGQRYPFLQGIYLYSDLCTGVIWGLTYENGTWVRTEMLHSGVTPSAFGEDKDGELYMIGFHNGKLYQITAAQR